MLKKKMTLLLSFISLLGLAGIYINASYDGDLDHGVQVEKEELEGLLYMPYMSGGKIIGFTVLCNDGTSMPTTGGFYANTLTNTQRAKNFCRNNGGINEVKVITSLVSRSSDVLEELEVLIEEGENNEYDFDSDRLNYEDLSDEEIRR